MPGIAPMVGNDVLLSPKLPAHAKSGVASISGNRWASCAAMGHQIGHNVVAELLRSLNYSLQSNRKTREGSSNPDRDTQFHYINAQVTAALQAGEPAISVDTKKKELVGAFKNAGRELRPKGDPEPVRVHEFKIPELGRAVPNGAYDIAGNAGRRACPSFRYPLHF